VATLATLVRSGGSDLVATFTHVYVFVSLAAIGAGLVGLALVLRPVGASAGPTAAEAGAGPVAAAPAG
jgi:hypothetical protein